MSLSVNLNEFSIEQLEFALRLFEDEISDLNSKISFEESLPMYVQNFGYLLTLRFKFDTAILWKVQIKNAIAELKVQLS